MSIEDQAKNDPTKLRRRRLSNGFNRSAISLNDAGVTNRIPARDYFDPTLYLGTIA
jgi:hypothetical protein